MPRETFRDDLDDLRADVRAMGDDVLDQLECGLDALASGDPDLARRAIEGDDAINRRYLDLEAACIDLFALQQPVAGDLRFVAASFKILTDLERVGDLATNLGGYAAAADRERVADLDVRAIGDDARAMVDDALTAYRTEDPDLCREVAARDDRVDALCGAASERVVRDLIEREGGVDDGWDAEALLDDVSRLLLTVRDVERVADHGVNIAARTLYATEGDPELIY